MNGETEKENLEIVNLQEENRELKKTIQRTEEEKNEQRIKTLEKEIQKLRESRTKEDIERARTIVRDAEEQEKLDRRERNYQSLTITEAEIKDARQKMIETISDFLYCLNTHNYKMDFFSSSRNDRKIDEFRKFCFHMNEVTRGGSEIEKYVDSFMERHKKASRFERAYL